ncbi:MAG: ComEC family competence protein [Dehalococcoidia bacterium]|nr:ComEC family competence protein [Dehalococcoidia bacterium]
MATLALALGFLAGIALGRWLGWPWEAALVMAAGAALVCLWWTQPRARLLALGAFALACGLLRVALPGPDSSLEALRQQAGSRVVLDGVVAAQPELAGQTQRLSVAVRSVAGLTRSAAGDVTVVTAPYPSYSFGDLLRITGVMNEESWGGKPRLALRYPGLTVLGHGQGGRWRQPLAALRGRLADSLARALPEPQAALARGVFLGQGSNLDAGLTAAFRATGTSHLVAISGQNITIVVGLVSGTLMWLLGRRRALVALLAFVWTYTALAGAEPPVVRATVMASAYLLASVLGRQTSGLVALALALALAVMAGAQPPVLSDVSFQLSASAMVGLVLLAPRLQALGERWLPSDDSHRHSAREAAGAWLVQNLAVSIAAVACTWPIIAHTFHSFSWVGVPATLAGLPALPFIIATSAATAVAGLLSPPLATALGWVSWLPLTYLIKVVELFARIPGAGLQVGALPSLTLVAYYLALASLLWLWSQRRLPASTLAPALWGEANPRWRWGLAGLATAATLAWAMALTAPGNELVVRALAAPGGQAVLVEAPGRVRALVDGGPDPRALQLALARALPFWDRHLDLVVSTRSEPAYLTGLLDAIPKHRPRLALDLGEGTEGRSLHQEWRRLLLESDARVEAARPGTVITLGRGVTAEVVTPSPAAPPADIRAATGLWGGPHPDHERALLERCARRLGAALAAGDFYGGWRRGLRGPGHPRPTKASDHRHLRGKASLRITRTAPRAYRSLERPACPLDRGTEGYRPAHRRRAAADCAAAQRRGALRRQLRGRAGAPAAQPRAAPEPYPRP